MPWGSKSPVAIAIPNHVKLPTVAEKDEQKEIETLPPGIEPLVLWQPEELEDGDTHLTPIVVDPLLVQFLRPHQRYLFPISIVVLDIMSPIDLDAFCDRLAVFDGAP